MLTGLKGVKYGLQPGAKAKAPLHKPALKAFTEDDDDDEAPTTGSSIGRDIARQAAKKASNKKVADLHAAALAQDASVFDYDGVYDSIQEQRVQPRQQEKLARKSRYIEGLLDKAKERQREQDIIYERTLLKERAAEDHLFGDKERFVTGAYKAKLEADQKWLAEERVREALEARNSVVKAGHMGNFYRNVMTNNEAFGTATAKPAVPARDSAAAAAVPPGDAEGNAGAAADPAFEAARRAREAYEAAKERQVADAQAAPAAPSQQEAAVGSRAAAAPDRDRAAGKDAEGGRVPPASTDENRDAGGAAQQEAEVDVVAGASPVEAAKKPEDDREARAAAARERFLARKRKAPA